MRNEVSIVNLSNKLPLSFSIIECDFILPHMHSISQALVVIKGEIELTIEESKYIMKKDDIIIINPRQVHKIETINQAIILSVFLDIQGFLEEPTADNIQFQVNSLENPNDERYEKVRYLIYSIIRLNSQDNVNSFHNTKAIAYSLFAQLMNDFKVEVTNDKASMKQCDTITLITAYISDYYKERLNLGSIAQHFNYSISYLSKLFKNKLNTTFIDYYDNLRINYSLDQLLLSNSSIEEIAANNGFDTSRSYVRAFQNIFKCYPSSYRKQHQKSNINYSTEQSALQKEALDIILKDYQSYIQKHHIDETIRDTKEMIQIDAKQPSKTINNPVQKILYFGKTKNLFLEMIQKEIETIKKEIPYSYILLTDLLSPSSNLFRKKNNQIALNLSVASYLNHILKRLNLTPFFVLEFLPQSISFKELEEYALALALYFQSFKKPIMISIALDSTSHKKEDLLQHYSSIIDLYAKLKSTCQIYTVSPKIQNQWVLDLCNSFKNKTYIDYYLIDYLAMTNTPAIIKDKNNFNNFVSSLRLDSKEIIIENLNFTKEKNNLLNDTIYKSSFICKNVIHTIDQVYAILPNPMFDIEIQAPYQINPFDGSSGFYTYNFIRKSSYYANLFCSKLEKNLLKKGKNFIITANQNKMVILLNNYSHYSELYAENKYYELINENRYACFAKSTKIHFIFQLENINFSTVKIKSYYISKTSGSSYDKYMDICIHSLLDLDEFNAFKNLCALNFKVESKTIFNNRLLLEATLNPLESELIELTFAE